MGTGCRLSEDSIQSQMTVGLAEYTRPWKLFTLSLGIALLILGSFYYEAPDWDIPISLIMAILAYLTAPLGLRVIVERRWRLWPPMLFATWFTVDGSYWLYWHFKNPAALEWMREANFFASLSLYGICGVVWFYRGSLRQLSSEIGALFRLLRSYKPKEDDCENRAQKNTGYRMTKQPQTEIQMVPINAATQTVLHDFVRDAVSQLSEVLEAALPEFQDDSRWERGSDGHFREYKKRIRTFWPPLTDEWLHTRPDYKKCIECLKADVVVAPHLDRSVGTSMSALRLEGGNILRTLIYAMLDDQGRLAFTEERFHTEWQELAVFFAANQIAFKVVAPLPYLVIQEFPLRLSNNIVLDRLTDDEVTRCVQVGVIRPLYPRFPLIYNAVAVGIRKTMFLPKLIRQGDEPPELPEAGDEGSFGNRPLFRDDLVIDDVLSALRIFKHSKIRSVGSASWTDAPFMEGATSFQLRGQWPYGGQFELSVGELPDFLEIWHRLEEGAARFGFSVHRFNLAFDRGLLADRIVDLVIAAEALLLGDLDEKYRGELRFRFALRAAKFITHPNFSEHDIFRTMRRAYDARSAVVHGGSRNDTRLPGNQTAESPIFIDAIEELVRLGLRKALSMREDGKKLHQAEYWDSLVFSEPEL